MEEKEETRRGLRVWCQQETQEVAVMAYAITPPRRKIQLRTREQVLHSRETDLYGIIYGKAAIIAPLALRYLLLLGSLGAARLKPLSRLFPPSWTESSDFAQVLNVLLILHKFSGEKQPETEQLL